MGTAELLTVVALPLMVLMAVTLYFDWRQTRLRIFPSGRPELNPIICACAVRWGWGGVTYYFVTALILLGASWWVMCEWLALAPLFSPVLAVLLLAEIACVVHNLGLGILP